MDSLDDEFEKLLLYFEKLGIHKKQTGDYNAIVSPFKTTLTWSLRFGAGSLFMGFLRNQA